MNTPAMKMQPVQTPPSGKGPLPKEARGLCWGGFFLNWIWAVGNSTWIGLLGLIPLVNIVMSFVLLFKGREWAWKNGNWRDLEHFKHTQKNWSIAGIVVFFFTVPVFMGIIAAIAIPNFQRFQQKAMQAEAKVQLAQLYTQEKVFQAEHGAYSADLNEIQFQPMPNAKYVIGFASTDPELAAICPDCNVTTETFKAVAVGMIGSTQDVWTVDQDHKLVHLVDGSK